MRNILPVRPQLAAFVVAFLIGTSAQGQFAPVALTAASYNADIVVESNYLFKSSASSVTVTMDNGPQTNSVGMPFGGTYGEQGIDQAAPNTGLPHGGTLLTSATLPDHVYQLPSSWAANNVVYLGHYSTNMQGAGPGYTTGSIKPTSPGAYTALSFLAGAGLGPAIMALDVLTADGNDFHTTIGIADWWGGSATEPTNVVGAVEGVAAPTYGTCIIAYRCQGQVNLTGAPSNIGSQTQEILWSLDVPLPDTTSPVTNIVLTYMTNNSATQGGCAYFAVSGNTSAGGPFNPIAIGGYDADIVVEAAPAPYPFTATLDNGTNILGASGSGASLQQNTGATFFEMGYDPIGVTNGIPGHGSTFTSFSTPATYRMAPSYTAPNAILIDSNLQSANIQPATPAAAASLSFLVTGAGIGSANIMSNLCIVQHQDGVNETNFVLVNDWFNNSPAPAWVANGGVNFGNSRQLVNFNGPTATVGNDPRLFDSAVVLHDTTSPVTNIVLQYWTNVSGPAWHSFVLAIAADTNISVPIVASAPPPYELSGLGESSTLGPPTIILGTGLSYQWFSGTTPIAGATNATYPTPTTLAAGAYSYSVTVSNSVSSASFPVTAVVGASLLNNAGLWTLQYNDASWVTHPFIAANVLELTDNQGGEACSAFYNPQVPVSGFIAAWTYRDVSTGGADGWAFCIQNDSRGATALGGGAGSDGVSGITPSADFDYDIYAGASGASANGGLNYEINGGGDTPWSSDGAVALNSGHPINVVIAYNQSTGTVQETLIDMTTATVFAQSLHVGDLTALVGSNAYVGFGAGNGGLAAFQTISNFVFLSTAPTVSITVPPANMNASAGQAVTFAATVLGSPPLTFQWQFNGKNIAGATQSALSITNVQLTNAGSYTIVAGTQNGAATATATATLSVSGSVSAMVQPAAKASFAGFSQTFTVTAFGTPPLSYQWFNGSAAIAGATTSSYTAPATLAAGNYVISVAVSNASSFLQPAANWTITIPGPFEETAVQLNPVSYWPLNETSGTVAYDYAGGNDGTYVNYPSVSSGYPGPNYAGFGSANNSAFFDGETGYIDVPLNNLNIQGSMSMFAWIQPTSNTKFMTFFGHSDSSYRLDDDGTLAHFADNPSSDAIGGAPLDDGNWHMVAGVYNSTNGNRILYVDGIPAATNNSSGTPAGSPLDVVIGGDPQYLTTSPNRIFTGYEADAAIYASALTAGQIEQIYVGAGIAPTASLPTNEIYGDLNGSVSLTGLTNGTPPLSLQWYFFNPNNSTVGSLAGQTHSTLTLSNLTASQSGLEYFLVAVNAEGSSSNASWQSPATLTVYSGALTIQSDISPTTIETTSGTPVTFSFGVYGTAPITYQWFQNGVAMAGATTSSYSFLVNGASNTFYVKAANSAGSVQSSTATVYGNIFLDNGTGWTISPSGTFPTTAPHIANNTFFMTDGNNSEGVSGWYSTKVPINGFIASFTFTVPSGTSPPADGMSFALQNSAVNARGGTFSISGVKPSVEWDFNVYPGNNGGVGISYNANGTIGPVTVPNPIATSTNGPWPLVDPINVTITYNQSTGTAVETLQDTVTGGIFTTNIPTGDITSVLGATDAWVGFTAATGGLNAVMHISNFSFNTYAAPPTLRIWQTGANTDAISWTPPASPNFVLQQSPTVTGVWANVTAAPTVNNGVDTIAVTNSASAQFYRLIAP
jgi:hypothetical protein